MNKKREWRSRPFLVRTYKNKIQGWKKCVEENYGFQVANFEKFQIRKRL